MTRALSLFLLLGCLPAYATNVTVVATGKLDYYYDPDGLLSFDAPLGAPVTLTLSYDSNAPDRVPSSGFLGSFAITSMSLATGGNSIAAFPQREIQVWNDAGSPGDGFADNWIANTRLENTATRRTSIQMVLTSRCSAPCAGPTTLASDALVPPPWPADWTSAWIYYRVTDQPAYDVITLAQASARIEEIRVVPLPPAVWLLATALASLARYRPMPASPSAPAT